MYFFSKDPEINTQVLNLMKPFNSYMYIYFIINANMLLLNDNVMI